MKQMPTIRTARHARCSRIIPKGQNAQTEAVGQSPAERISQTAAAAATETISSSANRNFTTTTAISFMATTDAATMRGTKSTERNENPMVGEFEELRS